MKKHLMMLLALLLLIGVSASPTLAALVSTFDSGNENWTTAGDAKNFTWVNTGGNPGGFIKADDKREGITWFFVSPDSWDGDWSGYIGGSLEYDFNLLDNPGSYYSGSDVRIYRDNAYAYKIFSINPPENTWTHFQVNLVASNFTIFPSGEIDNFGEIMANVTALYIRGEYTDGYDKGGLDNVRVTAIPLPAAVLLLGTGLVGLGAVGWRRRKRS